MNSEGLHSRIARLLAANVHALVGSIESRTPLAVPSNTCASSTR